MYTPENVNVERQHLHLPEGLSSLREVRSQDPGTWSIENAVRQLLQPHSLAFVSLVDLRVTKRAIRCSCLLVEEFSAGFHQCAFCSCIS